jgi:hypothetical protein
VAKITTQASVNDYRTAATCQNFVVYGSALSENATNASLLRAKTLLCDCFEGLYEVAVSENYVFKDVAIDWYYYLPRLLVDGLLIVEGLLELFPNALANVSISDCEFVTLDSIFSEFFNGAYLNPPAAERIDLVDYPMLNIYLGLLCAVITVGNLYMHLRTRNEKTKMLSMVVL